MYSATFHTYYEIGSDVNVFENDLALFKKRLDFIIGAEAETKVLRVKVSDADGRKSTLDARSQRF